MKSQWLFVIEVRNSGLWNNNHGGTARVKDEKDFSRPSNTQKKSNLFFFFSPQKMGYALNSERFPHWTLSKSAWEAVLKAFQTTHLSQVSFNSQQRQKCLRFLIAFAA
jgi:hypothetical protein